MQADSQWSKPVPAEPLLSTAPFSTKDYRLTASGSGDSSIAACESAAKNKNVAVKLFCDTCFIGIQAKKCYVS